MTETPQDERRRLVYERLNRAATLLEASQRDFREVDAGHKVIVFCRMAADAEYGISYEKETDPKRLERDAE